MTINKTINVASIKSDNSLSLFRLLACLQVMLCNHMPHFMGVHLPVGIHDFINLFHGVPVFFILSGLLIWNSVQNSGSFKVYFSKRILRLYPELWVCLAVELLSIIIFYKQDINWGQLILFAFTQGTLFQFWTPESLREYGCGCPNGALWTITVMVQFYMLMWFCYKKLYKTKAWADLLLFFALVSIPVLFYGTHLIPPFVLKFINVTCVPYLWIFYCGCLVAKYFTKIINYLCNQWLLISILLIVFYNLPDIYLNYYRLFYTIILALFIVGFSYRFPQLSIKKDISYGIYIYNMVFVNVAIEKGVQDSPYAYLLVILLTVISAYISYEIVGAFSRRKRNHLISK